MTAIKLRGTIMTHNLLGVGDDRWLRESLRRDPLQELRECKEELARKVSF